MTTRQIDKYIHFDNCIILQDPKLECCDNTTNIYYNSEAVVGKNIKCYGKDQTRNPHNFSQYDDGINVRFIRDKRVALLCESTSFFKIIKATNHIEIQVPFNNKKLSLVASDLCYTKDDSNQRYVLIMLATNIQDRNITKDSRWNSTFGTQCKSLLKRNIFRTRKNRSKH